jgi:hypothetical protein
MNLCQAVGRKEARLREVVATADRVRCGEAYGSRPPPAQVIGRHRPRTSRRGAGRWLLRKIRISPSWSRRGRKGLRLWRGAFSHGCSGSYGGRALAASRKFVLMQSPGFEAPARTVGKYGRREGRRCPGRERRAMAPRPRGLRPSHGRPHIVIPQPGAGGRGLGSRLGVPTPARFDGEFRKGLQDKARVRRRAFSWEDNEPVADGGVVAPNPFTGGAWGQAAATSGEEFEQRGVPVRSAHCFRVSPDPGESWSTAMGSGRRHRQVLAGAARSEDRDDLALQHTPRATVGGMRGVFSCGFLRLG